MHKQTPVFIFASILTLAIGILWATSGVIIGQPPNVVDSEQNSNHRFEPSTAAGSLTWVMGWQEKEGAPQAYVSSWNTGASVWNSPQPITLPGGDFGSQDVNVTWDPARNRFVYVVLGYVEPKNVYYSYSLDASGSQWASPEIALPLLSPGSTYDYPSIAVNTSGTVTVGAVRFTGTTDAYISTSSSDGVTFCITSTCSPQPGTVVPVSGSESRVVSSGSLFEAFVPTLDSTTLTPTKIDRWESSDGLSWSPTSGIGMGMFQPPANNPNYPAITSTDLFYAPIPAAAGSTSGLWAVAFQITYGSNNNVVLCTSDRGCGIVNAAANDEFLAGVSAAPDGGYWVSYHTYAAYPNPPLITQALYYPPGASGIGATTFSGINPTSWYSDTSYSRCRQYPCFVEGDYNGIASVSGAASSTPFIQTSASRPNDLSQIFLFDPAGKTNLPNFKPNWIKIPLGADIRSWGNPIPPACYGVSPTLKEQGEHPQ